jgi:hypothetical protein
VTGQPFRDAFRDLVLTPLAIEGALGGAPPRALTPLAGLAAREAPEALALGFPAAHLVTAVAGALALARAFWGVPAGYLRPATRAAATRDQTGGLGGGFGSVRYEPCPWGLGPELRRDKRPHWPRPGRARARSATPGAAGASPGSTPTRAWAGPPRPPACSPPCRSWRR